MQLACQTVIADLYCVSLASICLVFRTRARHSDWLCGVACFCGPQGTWSAVSCFDKAASCFGLAVVVTLMDTFPCFIAAGQLLVSTCQTL